MSMEQENNKRRISKALQRGFIVRNLKTLAIMVFALSGAVAGTPWLIFTLSGATIYLYSSKNHKDN